MHPTDSSLLYTRRGQRKYLNPDERRRFLVAARSCTRPELRTLCLVLAYTGCRISEALSLTPAALALADGFISVRSLKKRKGRVMFRELPIPEELAEELRSTHRQAVLGATGRLWRLSRSRAWQLVKMVMQAAGISGGPHATPKGLRHGFGLHAVRSGVPLNLVQKWLGHASMSTTAIYLQAIGSEEREFASRMWSR
jgi:integrase/recombinase XerD